MNILAIDPGNIDTAYCVIDAETLKPIAFDKTQNELVLEQIVNPEHKIDRIAIEMIASYGMPVGKEVFDTCRWIGRFEQAAYEHTDCGIDLVYRKDVKLHICGDSRANDTNIRHALIDRFATHDLRAGKGTKKNPDFFYGFRVDIWAAFAVGITYIETEAVE